MQQTLKKNYNLIRKTTCCVLYRKFTFTLSKYSWYSDVSSNWLQYIKLNRFTYERTHCQSRKKRIVRQKHFIESEPFQHTNTIFSYIYFFCGLLRLFIRRSGLALALPLYSSFSVFLLAFLWLPLGCCFYCSCSCWLLLRFYFVYFSFAFVSHITMQIRFEPKATYPISGFLVSFVGTRIVRKRSVHFISRMADSEKK